jgi:hypothetical protein
VTGQQVISSPVSLLTVLLTGLFSHPRFPGYLIEKEDLKRLGHTGLSGYTYSKTCPSGLAAGDCRTGHTLKKPKYLSVCDRDERGCGEGVVCMCERVG